jgi:hypothetical protein
MHPVADARRQAVMLAGCGDPRRAKEVPTMPTKQITDEALPVDDSPSSPNAEESLGKEAIRQIERKRHFHMHAIVSAALTVVLVIIWATAEYSNAGGWPTNGFSQSSGESHVWNIWIIYPVIAIAFVLAVRAWTTFRKSFISERDIRREMDRLTGVH